MSKVLLDRIDGARLQTALQSGNIVLARMHTRVAIVTDIAVDASTDANVLVKALAGAGLPQLAEKHPSGDGSVLQYHDIRPMSNNQAKVLMYYAPIDNGNTDFGGPEFTLEDGVTGQNITTQLFPGNGSPIRASYNGPGGYKIPSKSVDLTYYQPMRTIVASALNLTGDSTWLSGLRKSVGYVNLSKWLDLGPGYWLFYGLETSVSITSGTGRRYNARATLTTKNFIDWSFIHVLHRDGNTIDVQNSEMDKLKKDYISHQPGDADSISCNGAIRIFPYPTTDFGKIFNFSRFDQVNGNQLSKPIS